MEHRRLGRTSLTPGIIGMGTWRTFDVPPDNTAAVDVRRAIVDTAIAHGTDLFDSSPMYGDAEEVLGRTLEGRRGDVMVATKVWAPSIAEGRRQIARALAWYGGIVDVYQVHNLVAWQEYLPILRDLQNEGRVRAVGITHYAHSAFPEMRRIMETEALEMIQIPYNAADRLAERDLLPLAAEREIGVIVMSPLGSGDLVRRSPPVRELQPLQAYGVDTWAQALLKWVVSDARVTVAIPATSRVERAAENAQAGNGPFFGPEERDRVSWLAEHVERE